MTRTPIVGSCTLWPLLLAASIAAQDPLPRIAYDEKDSVAKIEIHLKDFHDSTRVSDQLKPCFQESDYCVIGTASFLNDEGDVLTAAHVARDAAAVSQTLRDLGIDSELMVAGHARNAEYVKAGVSSGGGAFRASIKTIDPEHDLAVLQPDRNQAIPTVDASRRRQRLTVQLANQRPTAGDAVFAFGFAPYSPALITAVGSITLAVGSQNLIEARKSGDTQLVPVYRAGLNISPSNSGGPLFRSSDGALLGIVSEIKDTKENIEIIIPATEIAKVLSANAIKWTVAPPPARKHRRL
jgi:S1-C subfamily serine protease